MVEVYCDVEKAIDFAFDGKFVLKFYDYLRIRKTLRREVKEFIESSTASNLSEIVTDLDLYLKGGNQQLREAYGHLSKPQARKIRNYLYNILEDAWTYNSEKRKRRSKNKTK
tara:strand:- start:965 stop:1300 length:336 start_codon:yes stop_codon:yes gene_type:complete